MDHSGVEGITVGVGLGFTIHAGRELFGSAHMMATDIFVL